MKNNCTSGPASPARVAMKPCTSPVPKVRIPVRLMAYCRTAFTRLKPRVISFSVTGSFTRQFMRVQK